MMSSYVDYKENRTKYLFVLYTYIHYIRVLTLNILAMLYKTLASEVYVRITRSLSSKSIVFYN